MFLYLTKPFPPFIDGWKSPCAFLLWGYCVSVDSPLSLTRLLFRHALYRPKVELRVHRQVENCPLRSSFHKRDMNRGISNQKKTFDNLVFKLTITIIQTLVFWNALTSQNPKSGQCYYCITLRTFEIVSQSGHEGKTVYSRDTESHCEVRTTADMKLSTACHHDFTLCPSDSSPPLPMDEKQYPIVLFHSHKCSLL